MAEVVDSIIAQLEVRLGNYVTNFDQAVAAHDRFNKSRPDKIGQFSTTEVDQYASRHKQAANDVAASEEQTTAKVTQSRKARSDAVKQADVADAASAKASAAARVETEEQAQARISAMVDRGIAERAAKMKVATTSRIGATVPREGSGQSSIPTALLAGGEDVAAEAEVNHLLADQATLRAGITTLTGAQKREAQDILATLRLESSLRKENVAEEEIQLRLETLRGAQAARNAAQQDAANGRSGTKNAEQFARGLGAYQATGGAYAIAGLAAAGGVAAGAEAVDQATSYAKALQNQSRELGLSTTALQVYQAAARNAGVSDQQLQSGLGQLAANLGKAREGSEDQIKVFAALGINIKGAASAGDLLPTLIARISSIADPAQRAALETRLFGEEGRRLDPVLSGGVARINDLAAALERTGAILSAKDIQDLDQTARKLAEVKAQLNVDLAHVVAGNAGAIESLAASFATLAQNIGNAITNLEAFNAKQTKGIEGPSGKVEAPSLIRRVQGFITGLSGGGLIRPFDAGPQLETMSQADKDGLARIQGGKVDPKLLASLGAPKGPKGPSDATLAKQADERQKRYEDELAKSNDEYLTAKRQITADADDQFKIDSDQIEAARLRRNQDIQREANEKHIDAAKVTELQAANDVAAAEKQRVLAVQAQVAKQNTLNDLYQQQIADHIEALQLEQSSATTAVERRRLELGALADERKAETAKLTAIVQSNIVGNPNFDPSKTDGDRTKAQAQLDSQDDRFDAKRKNALQSTKGPLETFRDQLPRTKDQVNEALQSIEADGLKGLEDQITSTISGVLKLGGVFGTVADQVISDLIRIGVQKEIIGPLGDALFGGVSGDAGLGKYAAGVGDSVVSSILGGTRASGGGVVAGVPYLVGEQHPEIFIPSQSGKIVPNNGAITPYQAGGSSGPALHFDLRNAVMTPDLLAQMQQLALQSGGQAYVSSVAHTNRTIAGLSRRTL